MKASFPTKSLLLKSLFAFSTSLFGILMRKPPNQLLQTLFTSDINADRGISLITSNQEEISAINTPFGALETANDLKHEVYWSYVWFMAIMFTIETIIFLVKAYSNKTTTNQLLEFSRTKTSCIDWQTMINRLKRFTLHIVKMICLSSLCYLVCIAIFVVISFACNAYRQREGHGRRQEAVLNDLTSRNLEGQSLESQVQDVVNTVSTTGRMLISSSLNSDLILTSDSMLDYFIESTIYSNQGNVFFDASYSFSECIFTVFTIAQSEESYGTNLSMSVTGSLTFPLTANEANLLGTDTDSLSLAISSDETTAFMTTPTGLQIIDISDLTYPFSISSFSLSATDIFDLVTLSPDDNTAFLVSNNNQITVVDITNLESPQFIASFNSTGPIYSLYTYGQSMFASISNLSVWEIYNISNVSNITLQGQLKFQSFQGVQTVGFSSNYQTAYVGTSLNGYGYINLVNITGNVISNTIATTPQVKGFDIEFMASIVESPDNRHIFISGNPYLEIFDISVPTSPFSLPPTEIPGPTSIAISPTGQIGLFAEDTGLHYAMQFSLNLQLSQAVDLQDNVIGTINISSMGNLNAMAVSPNSSILYLSTVNVTNSSASNLMVVNVSNPANTTAISFPMTLPPSQMQVSSDGNYLFTLVSSNSPNSSSCMFEIYNLSEVQLVSSYDLNCSDSESNDSSDTSDSSDSSDSSDYSDNTNILSFEVNSAGNIAVIVENMETFIILDVSNRTSPILLSTTTLPSQSIYSVMLSDLGHTVFLAGETLYSYDISTPTSPALLSSLPLGGSTLSLSIDPVYLYVITNQANSSGNTCSVVMIEILLPTQPALISSTTLNTACSGAFGASVFGLMSAEDQVLFVSFESVVVTVDVTLSVPPIPPRRLNSYYPQGPLANILKLSPDLSTLFIGETNTISIINLQPDYMLSYNELRLIMGGPNEGQLNVLAKNSLGTYDASLTNYKFTDVSVLSSVFTLDANTQAQHQQYLELPSWMNFDYYTGDLTLDLSTQATDAIGVHRISATMSKHIPNTTFIGIGPVANVDNSTDLIVALVGLGYMDNEGFLTSSFDPNQVLMLGSGYVGYEPEIRGAMSSYFMQAWTSFSIVGSLTVNYPGVLPFNSTSVEIISDSPATINTVITLENAQFVTKGNSFTASFSPDNTQITLVGTMLSINDALSELIVFLNGTAYSGGTVNVTDSLNPNYYQYVPALSNCFKINSQPSINSAYFNSQIGGISPTTGEQFLVQFNSSTFFDVNNEPLTFALEMQDSSSQVPDWLQLNGPTLTGSPPMQLSDRDLSLKIVASNQYQSNENSFTLSVELSLAYILKLIVAYGGAFITIVGLYVYAIDIYNVFAKKIYTYSEEFNIKVGEKVNEKNLYPITCYSAALLESKLIMDQMDKRIIAEFGDNKPSKKTLKAKLAAYFCQQYHRHKLDLAKVSEMIEGSVNEILREGKTELKLYIKGTSFEKDLIVKLIINRLIIRLLDLKEEKLTNKAFKQIKSSVFNLVDVDPTYLENGCCKFSVNTTRLQARLMSLNITTFVPQEDSEEGEINLSSPSKDESQRGKKKGVESFYSPSTDMTPRRKSIEKELINVSLGALPQPNLGANIDLLTDVIEAYAFNSHILDANILEASIIVREKMNNIWAPLKSLMRFMKLDLNSVDPSGNGTVACGIEYKVKEDMIYFCGTADHTIKDKTLVLQITNRKGRILREVWIHGHEIEDGPESKPLKESSLETSDRLEGIIEKD